MKTDEALDPHAIGLLCSAAVMAGPQHFDYAIVEPGRRLARGKARRT